MKTAFMFRAAPVSLFLFSCIAVAQGASPGKSGAASTGLSGSDRSFVATAAEAGTAEVAMAKVARERAASSAVSSFAARMIDDHGKANQELQKIATSKGLSPSDKLSASDRSAMKMLQGASGRAFDQKYVHLQLAAHEQAVALFEGEAENGQDADLKAFADSTLPILRSHLQHVRTLDASVNGDSASAATNDLRRN
jgi:putative membrane protein